MDNLESIIKSMPEKRQQLLEALKILVDAKIFSLLARANANQLVDGRMDSDDEDTVVSQVRECRQTNKILLGFEESAKQLTKGIENA